MRINRKLQEGGVQEDRRYELENIELHDYCNVTDDINDEGIVKDLGPCEIELYAVGDKMWGYLHLHNTKDKR